MHPTPLSVRLLGTVEAAYEGRDVHIGPSRERECFAALVIRRDSPVTVEQLIDDLWGDAAPSSAVNVVHTYVSRLRRRIARAAPADESPLRSLRPGYTLAAAAVDVDADRFETDRRLGMAELWTGRYDGALTALERALTRWSGAAPLHGAVGPLATRERRRLAELHLDAIETSLALRMRGGGHLDSIAELSTLVRQHPYRERLWTLLMLGLASADRRGEALVAYHDLRGRLQHDLGIGPSRRAQELFHGLLSDKTATELWGEHFALTTADR